MFCLDLLTTDVIVTEPSLLIDLFCVLHKSAISKINEWFFFFKVYRN